MTQNTVKFPAGSDADLYAKTGVKGYGVSDDTVKLVEGLRRQGKLDSQYPDNYDYTKTQRRKGPQFSEYSEFSSNDGDATAERLREQYAKYGTGEFVSEGKNGEKVKNIITRTPKGANITPRNPKEQLELRKENIRRWTKKNPTAKIKDGRTLFFGSTELGSKLDGGIFL